MARPMGSGNQDNAEDAFESNINLHNFDSLSSPDGDYSYRQHDDLPSAPTSPSGNCIQASDDPYDRELGGFRKYDVDLGDSSDEDADSDSPSNTSATARGHSSEGLSAGSLFPSHGGLNPLADDKSSFLDLSHAPPAAGGIGRGASKSSGLGSNHMHMLPHTLAPDSGAALSGAVQSGGIGKSYSPPPMQVAADPADLTAAGVAELDLAIDVHTPEPTAAAYVDAPEGLNLAGLCAAGSKEWRCCTVRLGSGTVQTPPAASVLRTLGLKRGAEQLPHAAKLVKRKRCFGNRMCIWSLAEVPARAPQHRLTGHGLTLQNGTLEMRAGCVWGLDTKRTFLKDTSIKGGSVVIFGHGTDVTLSGVRLENCSVIVVGGARATLLQCVCVSAEVAVYAAGRGTAVEMRGCELLSCRQGVCAEGGASVGLLGLRCTQSTITCVEARGSGTKLVMRRCLVGEAKKGRSNEWDVRAVYVHSGAQGSLAECALMRATFGLWVEGTGTHVQGAHCKLRSHTRCGVLAAAGASVELQHCMSVGCKEFHGVEVGDEATHADLKSCVLQRNKRCGVVAYEGATVAAHACTAEGNGAAAFRARDRAHMSLVECTSKNDHSGLAVFGAAAAAEATHCVFEGSQTGVVRIGAGGRACATGCRIQGCREGDGVDVTDVGSIVQLFECKVTGNKMHAASAQHGGTLEAFDCVAAGNGRDCFKSSFGGHLKTVRCGSATDAERDNINKAPSSPDGARASPELAPPAHVVDTDAAYVTAMASTVF